MRTKTLIALAIALGSPQAASALAPPIPSLPAPSEFVTRITNPWFPLLPGTVYVYRGTKDGKQAIDVLAVTHRTRTIDGIRATVINDRLYENGRLAERTTDWYAQDRSGTVWYLGEQTATLNVRGKVRGIDTALEATVKGGNERLELIAVIRP